MSTSVDSAMSFVPWLRLLAKRGGGVISIGDFRALGRLADAIERECGPKKSEEDPCDYDC